MKQLIKKIIFELGLKLGVYISPRTDYEEIKHLLKKLYPISTDKNLVRMGAKGNGGYLVPNDLDGIEACFSPGVGTVNQFEYDCLNKSIQVFMADYSVDLPKLENNMHFIKKFIGASSYENFITLDDWIDGCNISDDGDLLLQMDIEGFEYENIMSISQRNLQRCRIILVEFHALQFLYNRHQFSMISRVFDKLLQTHTLVHNHPNNCCDVIKYKDIEIPPVMEMTFLRNDRITSKKFATKFPHELDFDSANKQTMVLPKCWYKNK